MDEDILARAGIFQGMDAASVSALLKDLVPESFSKGDTIIREGEPGDKLYIIVDGKLKLSRTAPDGRENLLAILGPSDMFGELSIFDPGPRTSSGICVTDVRTYTMDRQALRRWLDARPQIAEQLLRVLARCAVPTTAWPTSSSPMCQAASPRRCCSWPSALVARKATPSASTMTSLRRRSPSWWVLPGRP